MRVAERGEKKIPFGSMIDVCCLPFVDTDTKIYEVRASILLQHSLQVGGKNIPLRASSGHTGPGCASLLSVNDSVSLSFKWPYRQRSIQCSAMLCGAVLCWVGTEAELCPVMCNTIIQGLEEPQR